MTGTLTQGDIVEQKWTDVLVFLCSRVWICLYPKLQTVVVIDDVVGDLSPSHPSLGSFRNTLFKDFSILHSIVLDVPVKAALKICL